MWLDEIFSRSASEKNLPIGLSAIFSFEGPLSEEDFEANLEWMISMLPQAFD